MKSFKREFTPIEVSKELKVTNKTVINRLAALVKTGFVVPNIAKERIRSYELSDFTKQNEKEIKNFLSDAGALWKSKAFLKSPVPCKDAAHK